MKLIKNLLIGAAVIGGGLCASAQAPAETSVPKVYYMKDVTPENLVKVYQALERQAEGKKIGIKISTGESMKSNHLDTALIRPLVNLIGGNFIECNTAYKGNRFTPEDHIRTAEEHGYTALAPVDIMDAKGDVKLPLEGCKHLKYDLVGESFPTYDFIVVLSHFKGHQMGGFGGALKNISIGIGSSAGKTYIHTAGQSDDVETVWKVPVEQIDFIESMAEASKAIIDHCGDNILYINVANRLSVDCDCNGNPEQPRIGDLGVFASLDPVALDKACVDAVYNCPDPEKKHLIERIESRLGTHILDYGEQLGIGSQTYELITLE